MERTEIMAICARYGFNFIDVEEDEIVLCRDGLFYRISRNRFPGRLQEPLLMDIGGTIGWKPSTSPILGGRRDMKHLLLLSGKAQAGKDTFADSIASLGFHKYSFAKALKDEASRGGWDGQKDFRGRILLQELGSVWRHYEPDHWIRRLQDSIRHDMVAITDCRYRNEISLMTKWGYQNGYSVVTVRINRTDHDNGLSPEARSHPSECELDGEEFDVTVYNYGPLLDFCANARWVAKCLLSGSWWV